MSTMRKTAACALLFALAIAPAAIATPDADLEGVYVEARSAQVYIGGCIWNSEAVTVGREAVMAWRIDRGSVDGVDVAGLSVVAAIAGDANLALRPEAARRTVLYVDAGATETQREALAGLYAGRNAAMFGEIVEVLAAPISFESTGHGYRVRAGDDIALEAEDLHIDHSTIERCGEAQWYEPFVTLQDTTLGLTIQHSYQGAALNARWSDPNSQSSFFGRFSF